MKKAGVIVLSVLLCSLFFTSCLSTNVTETTITSDVDCYGNIDNVINKDRVDGDLVFAEGNSIRPAVWITLSDDILKAKV